ncbi:MAG: hypothetical protein FWF29_05880, partial [Treponema sp.]|nr:hypothetical protein [Treponema sp.]
QNLTSSGLDAALSAAKSAYGNANSTIPELEDAASVLWDAVLALKDMLQSGTQSLPDGTNIASRYGLYTAPETSSGLASNAFNDSASNGTRWIPGVPEPVLEIAFAYPATLGGLEFNAYSTSAGGDSGIRDFRLEYLDGSAWKSAFEYGTPGVSVPGDAGTSSSFETYFTRRYSFDQEYTSVRFRLKVTSSAFNPSFWRIRLLSSTTGRIPLVNAISEAQLNLASVEISTDGSDINLASQWVTQAVHTAYNNAISAALDVTQVNTSTGVQLSGAMEALNTATTAFNNEKKAGSADPVLIAKREALLKKIADTEEWLKLHKTGTAAGNYYPFEFAASSAAKTALNSAITEAKSAPKTNVGEVDEASTAFENAITAFTDVRVTGTMALPAAGANIGNKHAYATETNKHSGTGGMNECLLNTTFLSANANRWGTTSGIVLPANGTVVFSAPVGVSAFKIYSFSSEGSSGTSGNGGRIRSFDIEYWNGTEWALCYRRVETTPIPGIRSQDLSNATTREANAFTAAFTDGRVESDKFRIVINTSIGVDFSIWHLQLLYAPSP